MKISEMPTEQGFELMAKIVPYFSQISNDNEMQELAKELRKTKNVSEQMAPLFGLMLCKHREALYGMVSAASGKTVEEVRTQPVKETKETFLDVTGDDVLDFFICFVRMASRV